MITVTVQDIMAMHPCQPTEDDPDDGYPESKLQHLFGARQSVTLPEICDDARVPIGDRLWVLHRLLPEPLVHEAACRYAERALDRERTEGRDPDPHSWPVTCSVARAADEAAVWYATLVTVKRVASGVDVCTAWAAERRWQLDTIREMIEDMPL